MIKRFRASLVSWQTTDKTYNGLFPKLMVPLRRISAYLTYNLKHLRLEFFLKLFLEAWIYSEIWLENFIKCTENEHFHFLCWKWNFIICVLRVFAYIFPFLPPSAYKFWLLVFMIQSCEILLSIDSKIQNKNGVYEESMTMCQNETSNADM